MECRIIGLCCVGSNCHFEAEPGRSKDYDLAINAGGSDVAGKLHRITINPAVMNGQPCIRGMRLTVRRVVGAAALYPDRNDLKGEYPELADGDIAQTLAFAGTSS
jgi:uncharacterized protein (DUF433 family)